MTPTPDDARRGFDAYRARLAENALSDDPHLRSLVAAYGRGAALPELERFGALVSTTLDTLARETNRDENLPRLRRYDGIGRRIEAVDFHPGYHEMGRLAYRTGMMSRYAEPGREFETLALVYLYSQNGEAGHACPMACTAGLIKILRAHGGHDAWLERLYDPDYDTHFHGSQFLTEVQGGSDVGANAVVATEGPDGWRIRGEKWFCSVIDANLFLMTARVGGAGTGGLAAFAVPRVLPDGRTNDFRIRRLKYKLGTRSMASSEVDFEGAWAVPVGDFKDVVEVVLNTSRLYNAICSAGMAQRAWREAHAYASTRIAFGRPILDFPTTGRIVARLRTEAYASRSVTFLLADLADRIALGSATDAEKAAFRWLVNLNKFWTSVEGTSSVRSAIEVLGGNGAIEEFSVLARLLRDSIVCEAWEGGHNVLCAQVLKDSRKYRLHEAAFSWLTEIGGDHPTLRAAATRFERLLNHPHADALVREVATSLRAPIQAAALRAERRRGGDPLLDVVIDDLLTTAAPGYDPFDDITLAARVAALNATSAA